MSVPVVNVPRVLREKLGEDGADALVGLLNSVQASRREDLEVLTDRFERRLGEELAKVRADIAGLESRLVREIGGVESGLVREMSAWETRVRGFVFGAVGVGVAFLTLVITLFPWLNH
ncbi:MAG: hypothetical protein QME87_10175 [Bacillota bacterium]|nr:hypothetical protein [Bacillota bacterium]